MTIKVGDTLPEATLTEFIEIEGNGCSVGPNAFKVADLVKGKVERFNGYLRRSFCVPLVAQLAQAGVSLDVVTANSEVRRWLAEVANQRIHGTTQVRPVERLPEEGLLALPAPWRGDIAAARPRPMVIEATAERSVIHLDRLAQATPPQHPLAVYEQLLEQCRRACGVVA